MFCPCCGSDKSGVIDSRRAGQTIRRRRTCLNCGQRFTTYESVRGEPGRDCRAEIVLRRAKLIREELAALEALFSQPAETETEEMPAAVEGEPGDEVAEQNETHDAATA